MFQGPVQSAEIIVRAAIQGDLFRQMTETLTSQNVERADLLFGLTLIGLALGAGGWIGWELMKFTAKAARRAYLASVNRSDEELVFRRPPRQPTEDSQKMT